jgi:hypothetical protein
VNTNLRVLPGGALAEQHRETEGDLLGCACGDAWFELADGNRAGAIAIQRDGSVAALVGQLRCASCGREQLLDL